MEMRSSSSILVSTTTIAIAITLLILTMNSSSCYGATQDTSCMRELIPCLNYLNGTSDPPDSCCDPLRSVIRSDPNCLCSMASTRGTKRAEQAGIDISQAQQLPARCGQRVNPIACLTGSTDSAAANLYTSARALASALILEFIIFMSP